MYKVVSKSILTLIFVFNLFRIYPDQNEDRFKGMNDENLFHTFKEYVMLHGREINNPDIKEYNNEILKRMKGSHTQKLEHLILKELESPRLNPEERKAYEFQVLCSGMIYLIKFDESYDQMTSILKDKNNLKHPLWSKRIINILAFDKYTKAIPVLSDIAYNKTNEIDPDVHIAAASALAVIGKPGVDLLINRFNEWENLPENDLKKQYIPLLWPLRFSKDKRALELAKRYINYNRLDLRVQALSVLASFGAKTPNNLIKRNEEARIMKNQEYEMYISCPDINEAEIEMFKNILLASIDNYSEDYTIRLISVDNLIYYPYYEVISALEKSKNNDPYKSFDGTYLIRDRATQSLEFLQKYYPVLFEKKKKSE